MSKVREFVLAAEIIGLGMLLGSGLYESVVVAPNFQVGIPQSLEHARLFWAVTNPGTYFRVVGPVTQLLALAAVVLCWKRPAGRRGWLIGAFVFIVVADIVTFTFHYPRNAVLFTNPLSTPPGVLKQAARQWANGNYLRVGASLTAVVAAMVAFSKREAA